MNATCKDPQNEVDDGYTPLHGSADFGHPEVAELLLQRGARVDAKIDQSEWTPLGTEITPSMSQSLNVFAGCASAEGYEKVVAHLLAYGAQVNVSPDVPLRLAVDGKWHESVIILLLSHGAIVENALDGLFHTETSRRLRRFVNEWSASQKEAPASIDASEEKEDDRNAKAGAR